MGSRRFQAIDRSVNRGRSRQCRGGVALDSGNHGAQPVGPLRRQMGVETKLREKLAGISRGNIAPRSFLNRVPR